MQLFIRIKIARDSKALLSRFKIVQQTNIEPYELLNVIKKVSVIKNIFNIQNFLKFYIHLSFETKQYTKQLSHDKKRLRYKKIERNIHLLRL